MRINIFKLSFIVLLIFSIFGVIFASVIIHENIHKFDYRDIEKINEEICYLSFSKRMPIGYYYFETGENVTEIEMGMKMAEIKAYSVSVILMLIWVLALTIVLIKKNVNPEKNNFLREIPQ